MLWGRQSASSALQEIFVHLLHKESSHVKMELTVRMDRQYALSVQVDIVVLIQVQILFSVKMVPMRHQEASHVYLVLRELSA